MLCFALAFGVQFRNSRRLNQESTMAEPSSGTTLLVRPPEDRLDSWKEIAVYLNRDVTTVQRWEKREGMPVHRHLHSRVGSVYASRAELGEWPESRNILAASEAGNKVVSPDPAASVPASVAVPRLRWKWVLALTAAGVALIVGVVLWLQRKEYFWRNPLADANFQTVTEFSGLEQAAAISRDGKFVAVLSDRDGPMDVWVTQVGSGQLHNLTHGTIADLVNPQVRTLGFTPDGAFVTFWARKRDGSSENDISIWAIPTLGGEPKQYLEGVAEYEWSQDGSRLTYHTPATGDPMFVSDGGLRLGARPIFIAPAGVHSHFPVWGPDGSFVYFVHGSLPDKLDIWRIPGSGGTPERITSHNGQVSHPVLLDRRTLVYLAPDV